MSALYAETSVTRAIYEMIDVAIELKQNASIIGKPGVGKTSALRTYVDRRQNAYLFTATAVTGNALRDLFREIADVLGIHASGSIADMQRQMLRYNFSGCVLIIDEAQNLKLQAFRELLNLWDHTGLCLIFTGNEEVLRRVRTDKGAFAQISRRVKLRSELNSILDEDADQIASLYGVDGVDAIRLLRAIGAAFQTDGVATVLQIAKRSAGDKPIRAVDIRTACEAIPHYRSALK